MDRYQKLLSEKARCKRELIGKMFFPRTPVFLIDLSAAGKAETFKDLLNGLESIHLTTLILGAPDADEMPVGKFLHYLPEVSRDEAYRAADFVIMQDGSPDTVREKGCVPISQLDGDGTLDYNPLREKGNGFYFKNPTKWEIFAAVVRATETYQFPYDWENLVREILNLKR